MTKSKNSTQGHRPKGVIKRRGVWVVMVRDHDQLRYYSSRASAAQAAKQYAEEFGYVRVPDYCDRYRNLEDREVWVMSIEVLP